jgi:ketosteroid isomerase-like protein
MLDWYRRLIALRRELDGELELIDAGDDVVALLHQSGRSKTTGLEVDMDFAQVWTIKDGKQTRMRMYADLDEALREVGLS